MSQLNLYYYGVKESKLELLIHGESKCFKNLN